MPVGRTNRRAFIAGLGTSAAWPPVVARGQQPGKLPTIGFLGPASASAMRPWAAAFVERLIELGWTEGRTVAMEYRWTDGHNERFPDVAAEFVRLKVDVIVTTGSAVPAFKQATSVIPIVFAIANDPVGSGLVQSIARPGGNVTGLSILAADLGGKRLEILREVIPGLNRLATLGDVANSVTASETSQVQEAARTLGLEVVKLEVRRSEDIAPAIEALKGHADALYVQSDPLMNTNRTRISILAVGARLPTLSGIRDYVEAGGLMSYGPNFADIFRRTGDYVDKILRGAKPADLPIEQPTRFDLVVNQTTAKALNLTFPPTLLARADEVIE
jgi:putative ABC transport system substrate-binding protein